MSFDGYNKAAWLNGINKYKLGGKHVLAGQKLIADIKRTLNINEQQGIGIPRYIVISKSGKILNNNAYRPSQQELLFQQILKLIQ